MATGVLQRGMYVCMYDYIAVSSLSTLTPPVVDGFSLWVVGGGAARNIARLPGSGGSVYGGVGACAIIDTGTECTGCCAGQLLWQCSLHCCTYCEIGTWVAIERTCGAELAACVMREWKRDVAHLPLMRSQSGVWL